MPTVGYNNDEKQYTNATLEQRRNGGLCAVRDEDFISMIRDLSLSIPCGGGIEYLHRSPASRKRRQKGNPVPGGMGHPVPGGYKYGDMALQVGGVSRIGTITYGLGSPRDSDPSGTALARTSSNSKL
jgi:hypothetical protein